jgi:uncharacterized protein YbjT (DUF2867 family)
MARIAAVTGASGFLGRSIVRELLSRGWTVRALVRDREKARRVLPATQERAIRLIQGDALDEAAVNALLDGASVCINTLGIIRESLGGQTFRKVHVESVEVLIQQFQAALQASPPADPPRFVQISAIGVSEHGRAEYQRTKWEGEQLVRASGIPWTILRPSTIHGPDGEFVGMVKQWVYGKKAPWFFLPHFTRPVKRDDVPLAPVYYEPALTAPVAVEDVAWAAAECVERPQTIGEIYNLPGPETLTWPEMLILFRDHIPEANRSLYPFGIPAPTAALQARIARKLGLGGLLPFDEGMAWMGSEDTSAELHKAGAHFDFQPIAFSERMPQYAGKIPG